MTTTLVVFFYANKLCIIDLNTHNVVTNGPHCEELYVLQNPEFKPLYLYRQCAASEESWHYRLWTL